MKNKQLFNITIAVLIGGAGALAYHTLLTSEARESITDLRSTVKESREVIRDKIEEIRGQIMEEDGLTDNRMRTRKQWADMGY